MLALALAGVGIGRIVDRAAAPAVARGELEPLLTDQLLSPPVPMFAVMLQERQRLPKIRACIDHWVDWMQPAPGRKITGTPRRGRP